MTSIEKLNSFISAVEEYEEKLVSQIVALEDASDVCDQAMGSDDISAKYITKLDNSIVELRNADVICKKVLEALEEDRRRLLSLLD